MDGKVYEAKVEPKEDARKTYTDARNRGQSAGLVEVK
jgi:hypothetical protein